ncbi:hypothetical protein [Mycolicibacterium gilvum]|uniref:Uncharacterized protein n=1 Tax=Mycolicibacterium gilvum (strain DSM 45189 / LMG 24558 / Spyr1) TaxID=278137 RepID=E6TI23_MYCSR|nr:hypothetical protein [Mycolicibacterium gilvum]ADT97970.1 hypothetical protein Mspyr1_12900 [Mycolicibacterium gilvum Spyr1]
MNRPAEDARDLVNRVMRKAFPEVSDTERDPEAPDDRDAHDRWLRDNIPPHHE